MFLGKKVGYGCAIMGVVLSLTACHPNVQPTTNFDKHLSCARLEDEIKHCNEIKEKIDNKRGFSARNVGLALVFWPGVIINEYSGQTAEDKANYRLVALQNIYEEKQCHLLRDESTELASNAKEVKKSHKG